MHVCEYLCVYRRSPINIRICTCICIHMLGWLLYCIAISRVSLYLAYKPGITKHSVLVALRGGMCWRSWCPQDGATLRSHRDTWAWFRARLAPLVGPRVWSSLCPACLMQQVQVMPATALCCLWKQCAGAGKGNGLIVPKSKLHPNSSDNRDNLCA